MSKKLTDSERRERILISAYTIACKQGFQNITRARVAEGAKCATGTVSRYFPMENLLRGVMKLAVKQKNFQIIQHNIIGPHAGLVRISRALKKETLDRISKGS